MMAKGEDRQAYCSEYYDGAPETPQGRRELDAGLGNDAIEPDGWLGQGLVVHGV